MLINLNYEDTIYIGKDTPVAYIKGEDASCEYLEVNEIIEDIQGIMRGKDGKGTKGGTSNVHLYSLFLSSSRVPE